MEALSEYAEEMGSTWVARVRFEEIADRVNQEIDNFELLAQKASEDECRKIFEKIDTDGSGFIEADEVEAIVDVLKIALAEHEKDELMRLVEDECNGALDFDEFYKWYQHFKPTVLFEEDDEEVNEDKDDPLTE